MNLHEHNIPKKQEEQKFLKTADVIRNTETKQDDIPFDPERDITAEEWKKIIEVTQEKIKGVSLSSSIISYLRNVENINLVSPFYAEKLNLPQQIDLARQDYSDEITLQGWTRKNKLVTIFNCFPELRNEFKADFFKTGYALGLERRRVRDSRDEKKWNNYLCWAYNLALLVPENRSFLQLDNEEMAELAKYLQESQNDDDIQSYARMMVKAFLLFPQLRNKIKVQPKTYQALIDKFKEQKDKFYWTSVLDLAKSLTILSAESAEITPDGQIKITPKPKPLKTTEPLPQRPV